jgi:hypothetical protein
MPFPLEIDIASNRNVPSRIKDNLAARKRLVSLLGDAQAAEYRSGAVSLLLGPKEARIYRLAD